ncbi:uncharacterized protein LOC121069726 isoform X1 [Cygnus olor]|uniref:uncharacterized protein LOC121069726 isoform X1 n=1 Tax=Cygnus olor TaxID=8869 RepID=UPI001ADE96BF|nr:uncharacterized protein LOC121069726 isoform X1 [Cygnus olor]
MIIISLKLLLTMCFGSLATGPNNLTVIQTPTKIHLSIGDSAEIACIWEKSIARYRISWYLVTKENITKTISSSLFYLPNVTHDNKDVLVIKAVNVNYTGFYYCEIIIEIPFCKKLCGSGTTLIVEEKEAQSSEKKVLAVWAIIPFLVAVGSLYCCYKKKRNSKFSGSAPLPVPEGGRQDEQTLEAAELYGRNESTSEEAEWAVSTLYESLDSFYNESK